ncbi:PAS domain S-box protein [Taibaiella lutea]|uniref:Sensory/regulatory protein RpfC n=1 Tax=Taibaiella lutea TaxID=2608001 RepID=A0A5M6CH51_9BACT|nr:PAS domain-containing hybrid sensor histidine kinase/response regulator [Taibaiella lutea]KAA5534558.1 PAS domain S-box protein [Taibaiella lutea]
MKRNKLLETQLQELLPEALRNNELLQPFLDAISNSFDAFEKDIELSEKAFRTTEEEYGQINAQLKNEIKIKEASIVQLKGAVAEISNTQLSENNNELLNIASYLKTQVSLRIEAEQLLKDQKTFYEQILNQIPADIAIINQYHRYLFVNPTAISNPEVREWIIGRTDEDFHRYRGKPVENSIKRRQHFDEVIKSGKKQEWEEKLITEDGREEYHLRILHPVYNSLGEFEIMIIYGFNITERKKIEEKVKLNESRYRSIFDNSQALICTHDLNGLILEVNRSAVKSLGYETNELVGTYLFDLLPEDKKDAFKESYLDVIKKEGKAEGIMVTLSKQNKKLYLLYQNYLVNNDKEAPYVIGFSQDITARIEAERALKKSEEKYRNIIANMNLGLVEVNPQEEIIYANNSFCKMSGYSQEELIGKNATRLLLSETTTQLVADIIKRRKEGQADANELRVKNKKGELKWWLISGAPSFDEEGKFKGSIGIHLDITAHKELEEQLRKAKADAEFSAKAKEIFLANMSHEIRTPMNGIMGISGLLLKTQLDKQQKLYLDTIRNAANNLLIILNDVLDFSKIESGNVKLEYIAFDLKTLLGNAAQIVKYKAEEKNVAIQLHYDNNIADALFGDPYRLNQVLMNLLSNAIKFTDEGMVEMDCQLQETTDNKQQILFSVKDTGIGMSPGFLHHLFDKFSQEDESITRKFGGTGLGMSITQQLVEIMGGIIHVRSKKSVGTNISFSLSFPVAKREDIEATVQRPVNVNMLDGKSILHVEDNEMNRLLTGTILSHYGAQVTEAEDGYKAIEILEAQKQQFDLILMDIHMPGKDGLETARYIRKHIDNTIPIIALTANAFAQESEKCIAAGMNDFIAKPFEEEKLVGLIASWLVKTNEIPGKIHRKTRSAAPVRKASVKSGKKHFDIEVMKAYFPDDIPALHELMKICEKELTKSMAAIAVSVRDKNLPELKQQAHKLKGSALMSGMEILSQLAYELEQLTLFEDKKITDMEQAVKTEIQYLLNVLNEHQQTS